MSTPSPYLEALHSAIVKPTGGVVGVVDEVLKLCRENRLHLDWRNNQCTVRAIGADNDVSIEFALRKSVFRAILARIAFVCSEERSVAFAPYGGQGELTDSRDGAVLCVAWINTSDEQRLEITPKVLSKHTSQLSFPQISQSFEIESP
jgi:hypothetical protein